MSRTNRRTIRGARSLVAVVALAALAGCSDMAADAAAESGGWGPPTDGDFDGDGDDNGGQEPGVPEVEEYLLTEPAAIGDRVYVANTTRGTIAEVRVTGSTVAIRSQPVGREPTQVVARPGGPGVVVLNEGSDSLALFRPTTGTVRTFRAVDGANRLVMSPDGRTGAAFFDARTISGASARGSLAEVAFVQVSPDSERVSIVSAGTGIRDVLFDAGSTRAVIVTADGPSVVDLAELTGDRFEPPLLLDAEGRTLALGGDWELRVSADGERALLREADASSVVLVDLDGGETVTIPLPDRPTDLEILSASGAEALVSTRASARLARVPFDAEGSGDVVWLDTDGVPAGQIEVTRDERRAVVFSSAGDTRIAVLQLDTGEVQAIDVRKRIRSVILAPDGRRALVVHDREPGSVAPGDPPEVILARSEAVTSVDLEAGTSRLVTLDARPESAAFDRTGRYVFVALSAMTGAGSEVRRIDLETFRATRFPIDRIPQYMGLIPDPNVIFVTQDHPLGRIAFIDAEGSEVREVTGYELNSLIE